MERKEIDTTILKRKAVFKDRNWILQLMNEKEIRQNSFNTESISKKGNDNYWKKNLGRKGFEAYAIEKASVPVGLIRIIDGEVSIAITKKQTRKGIAYGILSKINLNNCFAEIKPTNTASIKLFKKLGFKVRWFKSGEKPKEVKKKNG